IRVIIGFGARMLDRHGLMPKSIMATDIHYASVVLSQLGSIKLGAAYHHLTEWGTNSLFITVGEKKKHPFYDNNGNMTMKSSIDIGFTVDERISDGFYFAKSVRLMKKLLEHPELLEDELNTKVLY
ncbi:MAG: 2-oxo acid dehydrogenase subunit E2, partial [Clostridiales bacterium]|nr:2-oxo acid dehydrogenase subunit E2 [Clostridiales bacterium]